MFGERSLSIGTFSFLLEQKNQQKMESESEIEKTIPSRYTDSRILIGNWNEENFTEEEKFRKFLLKRDRGNLISQKTARIYAHFLREIQLEVPCDFVRFGAIVQLKAPDMPNIEPQIHTIEDQSLVVSIAVDGVKVNEIQRVNGNCILSLAPSIRPCVRNSFIITSPDSIDRTNEILKYNQDFNLKCVDADEMICSTPKNDSTLGSATYSPYSFFKNGEINQTVGLAVRKNEPGTAIKAMHFRWKCLNVIPSVRFETEGEPVPSNTKLVICHSATHKLLAGENTLFKGIFGMEYGLSATTYQTVQKIETFKNVWIIKTSGDKID